MIIPLKPVRILGQTTMVDIAPTSQFGSKTDSAVLRTQLLIENDQPETSIPLSFLTMDANESDAPSLRVLGEKRNMSSKLIGEVDRQSFMDQAIAAAATAGSPVEVVRDSLEQVFDRAARHHKTFVTLRQNEKLLLEFVSRERLKLDEQTRSVSFATLAPLPQYQLAAGGTLWLTVALPRSLAGLNVALTNATQGFNKLETDVYGRKLVSWQWQNDPLLSVTYQYS